MWILYKPTSHLYSDTPKIISNFQSLLASPKFWRNLSTPPSFQRFGGKISFSASLRRGDPCFELELRILFHYLIVVFFSSFLGGVNWWWLSNPKSIPTAPPCSQRDALSIDTPLTGIHLLLFLFFSFLLWIKNLSHWRVNVGISLHALVSNLIWSVGFLGFKIFLY